MNWEFNYNLYEIAVAIQQYAERLATYPDDKMNLDYCQREAVQALETCKAEAYTWSIEKFASKGKKLAGRITVQVRMNKGTTYGFSYMPERAEAVYDNLMKIRVGELP